MRRLLLEALGGCILAGLVAISSSEAEGDESAQLPKILFNRWQEDWSVLSDSTLRAQEPFGSLKYIPLSPKDPFFYLSFGVNIRERYEGNSAQLFGTAHNDTMNYVISRTELHADFRLGKHVQLFTQMQSDFAPGKSKIAAVDQNRADLEQAFVVVTEKAGPGVLKARVGRQQFAFDLQRFVSVRDGPNVRQSYDAAWLDYETGPWRTIGFYSHPVQNQDKSAFDDYSNTRLTLGGFRVERKLSRDSMMSAYYSYYRNATAKYLTASGNDERHNIDIHTTGKIGNFDWDTEAMGQFGHVGMERARAWAVGSIFGYTFGRTLWTPRIGIQADAASGDGNPRDRTIGTFNPLFPNGAYVNLAGYTGYVNFIHIKPFVTIVPAPGLKLMFAAAPQWRQTTADAVYTQPNIAVPNTAGHGDAYEGTYGQFHLDWAASRSTSIMIEAVHFAVARSIRRVGGHDGNYIGVQVAYGW